MGRERKASATDLENLEPGWSLAEHQRLEYATTSTPRGPGPSSSPPSTTVSNAAHVYPSSTLVKGLDFSRWTTTIEDKYFGERARREGPDFRGPSRVEGGSFGHSTGVVSLH